DEPIAHYGQTRQFVTLLEDAGAEVTVHVEPTRALCQGDIAAARAWLAPHLVRRTSADRGP
ncbi:MAG TPA: hypothetical protein VEP50_00005, partial [bacterium]|nr:hypothetical protein [bacterium]